MSVNSTPAGNGLTSLTLGDDLGAIVTSWRPRRIAIAGVRFNSGGDDAAAKKAADDAAAVATAKANEGKTPEQIAADKKTADDAAAATKKAEDEAAAKNGKGKEPPATEGKAPDKYELTVPDEAKTAIGDKHIERITAAVETFAKENGLTAEQAQTELDARLDGAATTLGSMRDEWLAETKAHKTYGGEKLEETQQLARRAVDGIFPVGHELREAFIADLNQTGIGNKLTVVAFLASVGKHMGEDNPAFSRSAGKEEPRKKDSDVLFPSSAPKT